MKKLTLFIVLVALAVVGYFMWPNLKDLFVQQDTSAPTGKLMTIENYIAMQISELSPVKEQLGGRFYVTSIQAADGHGVVSYEDGHNAYTADFTYTSSDQTGYTITSFEVRS